ncbi:MAG: NDP-sugar synthase, partial [Pseudomonadota bacterium]
MAAGYGTRLEPLTLAVPKPMVPIVNKPTMLHNIQLLRKYGVKEIAANIHYHPEQIKNFFGSGRLFDVKLSYSYEEELMGTAGGVKRMAEEFADIGSTFIVLSSDALTDINLRKLVEFHKKKNALVTMAMAEVEDTSPFGVLVVDKDGRIIGFQEKPAPEDAESRWVNAGIYVFEPEVLNFIPKGEFYDFGKQVFPELVKRGERVFGYKMIEYWSDVGNLSQYHKANADAMQGSVRIRIPGRKVSSQTWMDKGANVDKSAQFDGSIILGKRVHIGKNVKITGETIIGDM